MSVFKFLPLKGIEFLRLILLLIVLLVFLPTFMIPLQAGCTSKGFLGATPEDPVMSVVDISLSPVYSFATTSGTSGCKNWDFGQLLKNERINFVRTQHPNSNIKL